MKSDRKMITKKSIIIMIFAFLTLASYFYIVPLTEQYQGATGYIYENGMWYHLLSVVLLIVSIGLFCYSIVETYEVRN